MNDKQRFRYASFLCYARSDTDRVDALRHLLHQYHLFLTSPYEEAVVIGLIQDSIRKQIEASASLLVFCSHQTMANHFCRHEVELYLQTHATDERKILVILLDDILVPDLLGGYPLVNVARYGKKKAARQIAAHLIGLREQELTVPWYEGLLRRLFGSTHYQVFISYRREDAAEEGRRIREALMETGVPEHRIFLDRHSMGSGRFTTFIKNAIRSSEYFVWLISPESYHERPIDYYLQEVEEAKAHGIKMIPVLCKGATLDAKQLFPGEDAQLYQELQTMIFQTAGIGYELHQIFRNDERKAFPRRLTWGLCLTLMLLTALGFGLNYWSDVVADKVYLRLINEGQR